MAAKKKSSSSTAVADAMPIGDGAELLDVGRYVGQWNRLVSTTNWEKGRIIGQWRDALVANGAAASEFTDDAWTQLVGGVTSQHVGRLRRVYQRFGEASDQYDGLYWSHFQAAIDWEDAEMWLEGAIHNGWSVSQMRGKRWETLGKPGEAPAVDDPAEASGLDGVDNAVPFDAEGAAFASTSSTTSAAETPAKGRARAGNDEDESDDAPATSRSHSGEGDAVGAPAKSRSRLAVEVDELPEDLADAFEQFKLAIIAHRRLGWSETTPGAVIECLDALRELALAPADD